jgi:WD40 repeat protein
LALGINPGGTVSLWDTATGAKRRDVGTLPVSVNSLSFNANGTQLAAAGIDQKHGGNMLVPLFEPARREAMAVWDLTTKKQVFAPPACGQAVEFSPDGRRMLGFKKNSGLRLAPNTPDYVLTLWDTKTWKEMPAPPTGRANGYAFSADSQRLAVSDVEAHGGYGLHVFDLDSGKQVFSVSTPNGAGDVAFSPDGKRLAAVSGLSNHLSVWDVATGRVVRTVRDTGMWVRAVTFAPDGRLVTCNTNWDALADPEVRPVASQTVGHVSPGGISPDGSVVAIGQGSSISLLSGTVRTVMLRDAATGKLLHTLAGHSGGPTCLAFSADSRRLITGGRDKAVRVWDVETAREICAFLHGHDNDVKSVALSGDGRLAASTNDPPGTIEARQSGKYKPSPGAVKVWDVATGGERLTLKHPGPIEKIGLSPDGRLLITTGWGSAILWDMQTGKEIREMTGPGTWASLGLEFSPDGKTLVFGNGYDITQWDVATGREHALIRASTKMAFDGGVFRTKGSRLVTAREREVKLWDLTTGDEVLTLPLPEGDSPATRYAWVAGLAFTTDGRHLNAVLSDGSICAWDAPPPK